MSKPNWRDLSFERQLGGRKAVDLVGETPDPARQYPCLGRLGDRFEPEEP